MSKVKAQIYKVTFCPNCGDSNIEFRRRLYDERGNCSIPTLMVPHPEHIEIHSCYNCSFGWKINFYDNLEYNEIPDDNKKI